MRKAVVSGLSVAVLVLGVLLAPSGAAGGSEPVPSGSDPMTVNAAGPVCPPC